MWPSEGGPLCSAPPPSPLRVAPVTPPRLLEASPLPAVSPLHRPCCSKSDDFSTFGSIFLEKGFEREVRTSEQPQEGGLQGLGVGDRGSQHPQKVCSGKVLGNHPAATREGSGVHPACWGLCWSHHSACHAWEWFAYWGLGGFAPYLPDLTQWLTVLTFLGKSPKLSMV